MPFHSTPARPVTGRGLETIARKARRASHVAAFAILIILAGTRETRATTIIPPSFDALVRQAEVVLQGEVIDTRARVVTGPDGTTIVTDVSFHVDRVLKGTAGPTLVLTFLGGTVGDRTFRVDGIPTFARGDRDVLFAVPSKQSACPLVGMMHGRVRIVTDPATRQALVRRFDGRPLREANALTLRDAEPNFSPTPSMSLEDFERAVAAEAARQIGRAR